MALYRVSIFHGREARSFQHAFATVEEAKGALARLVGRILVQDDALAWMPSGFALDMSDAEGHQILSLNITSAVHDPVAPALAAIDEVAEVDEDNAEPGHFRPAPITVNAH